MEKGVGRNEVEKHFSKLLLRRAKTLDVADEGRSEIQGRLHLQGESVP